VIGRSNAPVGRGFSYEGFTVNNNFSLANSFVNDSVKAISTELDALGKMSENGIDITPMLAEMQEKVDMLRAQAKDMIDYLMNEENSSK